jgi:hypothetical protein
MLIDGGAGGIDLELTRLLASGVCFKGVLFVLSVNQEAGSAPTRS